MLSYRNNLSPPKRQRRLPAAHVAANEAHKKRQAGRQASLRVTVAIRQRALAEETAPLRQEIGADAERRVLAEAFRDGRIEFEHFKAQLRQIRQRVRAGVNA